jgi:chromosome segregation ATPase
MPALEDLEARVAALETQLRELADRVRHSEQDAAAARVLAGGADRDVTDLGVKVEANRKAINALGEQTAARFDRLEQRVDNGFAKVDHEFAKVDKGFAEIRGKLDAAAAGQQQIVTLLSTLIGQHGEQQNDQ